jgi:predicted transcriptional regulator
MRKILRRDRLKIYGDLLIILLNESRKKSIVLTHIQQKSNVPFDRLITYLAELRELGLIEEEPSLNLTDKGKAFINEYQMVLDFMERMGLTYR